MATARGVPYPTARASALIGAAAEGAAATVRGIDRPAAGAGAGAVVGA